ncbi:MAG: WD40 repeat domain-containing protein [Anaerolineales bacterium]
MIVSLGEKVSGPSYPGLAVFSPDGQIIAHVNPKIRFWNVNTHELIREIEFPFEQGCTFAESKFSPNGKYFAVSITNCWRSEDPAGKLLIWDSSTGQLLQEWTQEYSKMPGPTGKEETDYSIPVYAFAFLPNSTSVVFASGNTLETKDILDNQVYDVLNLGPKMYATEISLSSDARLAYIVMSWTKDHDWPILWTHQHKFQIWNIDTHAFMFESKYPEGWVNLSLKLLRTQLVQVDIEKATSQIRNLETEEVRDIPYRKGWRYYNSDGSLVVYARLFGFDDDEQAIELWRTDNWRNVYTFTPDFGTDWIYGMHDIVFSPDNTILAIEHQEQISLWNIGPIIQP